MGKRKRLYPENLLMELSLSLETGIDIDYENLTDDQLIGLEYVLSLLTERSQALIHEYYKNNKSRKQIAEQYHLTENRVRQCIGHVLRDLSKNKEMFFYIAKGYQANVQYLTEQLNNEEVFYKKQRGICSNDEHIFYQEIGALMGKNVTPEANCASNGFHCAENPLDCLTYYSDMDRSIYCLVQPGGDIDEDDRDSKIACTELTILRQLTRKEFFLHALAYMVDHPCRKVSGKVQREHSTSRNGYAIVRGKEPAACGKLGDILAFARERRETEVICQIAVVEVDGEKIQPGVWYDIDFVKREAVQK